MARFGKSRKRKSSAPRRSGSARRDREKEKSVQLMGAGIGAGIGGVEGFTEANRENQGKQARFVLRGDAKTGLEKDGRTKSPQMSVGNAAAAVGFVGLLAAKTKKAIQLAGATLQSGLTLTTRRAAYDYEHAKGKH